jgi:long-chain acyl-CoA synthetase
MRTLLELLPTIERLGRREAVLWSNGVRTWKATYSDLYGSIAAVTEHFDQLGLRKGDRVLIWGENQLAWIAAFWGCMARGIQVVPVDYRFSPELVRRIESESRPKLIIDNAYLDRMMDFPHESVVKVSDVEPNDIVEIVYTSGTTGDPKGVVHRHRHICANLRPFQNEIAKYKNWARPFQPVRILDLLPLSHMFGQTMGLFIPVLLEGAVAFTTEMHPARIVEMIHDQRITIAVTVPRILENLRTVVDGSSPIATHARLGWKFWAFVVGGARLDTELEEFWRRRRFVVIQGYGLTEASPVVAVNHPFHVRHGSLGKVVPGQDVKIASDGEILVRGESVTTEDWLHTGDLGEIDGEGNLYFRGRKKDLIVTPDGLNVHPDDVEAVLNSLPEIRDSTVIGTDQVHAVLIPRDHTIDGQDVVRRANEKLEVHQRIRTWSIWPDDDFPRTPSTLKVKRHEIARAVASEQRDMAKESEPDLSAMSSLERVELLSKLEDRLQTELDEVSFSRLTSSKELEEWLRQPTTVSGHSSETSVVSHWPRSLPVRAFRNFFQAALAGPLFRGLLQLTITGIENLDGLKPPVIFAANHTSHLDTAAIFTALPQEWSKRLAPAMRADATSGLTYVLACILYNTYLLPQQMAGTRRALRYTGELIDRGYCPLIFPEGERTPDGAMLPFRPGVGMMAVRLQVPVVPIRLNGLYEIYSIRDSWPGRGPVQVSIGKALRFPRDSRYEDATEILATRIRQL